MEWKIYAVGAIALVITLVALATLLWTVMR